MADTSTRLPTESQAHDSASEPLKRVTLTHQEKDDNFQGFVHDELRPSVGVLISLGSLLVFSQCLPDSLAGIASVIIAVYGFEWFRIHGCKLTREERTFFDEASLLQCTTGYDVGMDMCDAALTPYEGGKDVVPPGPASIFQALFYDQKKMSMQKFYMEHYGDVWKRSQRALKERQSMDKN